jgi:hypothetical protein
MNRASRSLIPANAPIWLTGDFNLPDISWKHNNISGNQNALGVNNSFLTLVEDIAVNQIGAFAWLRTNSCTSVQICSA